MRHSDAQLLLAPVAFGVADPDERRILAAHVLECADCAAELASFVELGAQIGVAAPSPVAPSPALRASVLGRIEELAAIRSATGADLEPETASHTNVRTLAPRRSSRRRWITIASPSLAAAACIALVAVLVAGNHRVDSLTHQRDSARSAASAVVPATASTTSPAASFAQSVSLSTDGDLKPASFTVGVSSSSDSVLVAQNLPSPGTGHAWQVWKLDRNGKPTSLGVIASGSKFLVISMTPSQMAGVHEVAVTQEPAGGSTTPTTPAVASGLIA